VVEIHGPGRTLTLMVASTLGEQGGWGNLDPDLVTCRAAGAPWEVFGNDPSDEYLKAVMNAPIDKVTAIT
jgi:hypothetical protein